MTLRLRPMEESDVDEVVRIIRLHDSDDARHARRFFNEGLPFSGAPEQGHLVCVEPDEERVVGVSGWGADLGEGEGIYWLGWTYVNPWWQGRGAGRLLFDAVLARVRELGGRKLFVATSSLEAYSAAVRFYERNGFVEEGRLRDFHGPGEHKLIFGLPLASATPV